MSFDNSLDLKILRILNVYEVKRSPTMSAKIEGNQRSLASWNVSAVRVNEDTLIDTTSWE